MSKIQPVLLALGLLLVSAATSGRVFAADIRWRSTYAEAYAEAKETGRPMFMEFSSEGCTWCKRLEAVTLSQPEVAKLINERFIPVRIDAYIETELARAVAVNCLPTLFVLAPDRTILQRKEGFAEPEPILQFLRDGLAACPAPAAIVRATDK